MTTGIEPKPSLLTKRQAALEEVLIDEPRGADGLTVCALTYLAIPNVLFLFGWFRLPLAVTLCATMFYFLTKVCCSGSVAWRSGHTRSAVLVIIATSCAWSAFGGGSHFMFANPDWEIRDAVLGDLVNFGWPVRYLSVEGAPLILRSAIGFFLPPALFGKIFGLAHIDLAVYAWTAGGVVIFLLLLPLPSRAGWRLAVALLLAVFFSGMDFVGELIATESLPMFPLRLEWWVPLSYPSLTNQLLWAPNHCLPIWIATVLYWRHRNGSEYPLITAAALPLTLIWTPFAVIGLVPFATLGAWSWIRRFGWHRLPWPAIVSATTFSVPIVFFLLLDAGGIESTVMPASPTSVVNYPLQPVSLQAYFLFISCEFLLLALVIAPHVRDGRREFWLALIVLLVLPLARFGPSNDLGLRLSTPALVVLLVICLRTLLAQDWPSGPSTLWVAGLFLVIGGHTAFNEFWRAATFRRSAPDYQTTLAERQGGQPAAHYVGHLAPSPLRDWLKPIPEPHRDAE